MARKIFVNLPVKDLKRSVDFFTQLGFEFNPQFTDENATSMIINDDAYVMLLVESFFNTFHKKALTDTQSQTEVLIALSADSKQDVDAMADKAIALGGRETRGADDQGFMYQRTFQDLDGHHWEVAWMDMSAFPQ
jgi:predicted lactoylglutathione lyase